MNEDNSQVLRGIVLNPNYQANSEDLFNMDLIEEDEATNSPKYDDQTDENLNLAGLSSTRCNCCRTAVSFFSQQYADLKSEYAVRFAKLEATLAEIKQAVVTPKVSVRDITVDIPISDETDLDSLDKQCTEKDLVTVFSNCRRLTEIIQEEVLLNFNWARVQGKNNFSSLKNLNQTLFGAFKDDSKISCFEDYVKFVKHEIHRIHNKYHQKQSRIRKTENGIV